MFAHFSSSPRALALSLPLKLPQTNKRSDAEPPRLGKRIIFARNHDFTLLQCHSNKRTPRTRLPKVANAHISGKFPTTFCVRRASVWQFNQRDPLKLSSLRDHFVHSHSFPFIAIPNASCSKSKVECSPRWRCAGRHQRRAFAQPEIDQRAELAVTAKRTAPLGTGNVTEAERRLSLVSYAERRSESSASARAWGSPKSAVVRVRSARERAVDRVFAIC